MPIRPIVRLGHPSLRSPARAVSPQQLQDSAFQALIDDMVETMRESKGVGLAAPQVAEELQLFVYEVASESREPIELTVAINPMVTPQPGELIYDWEGCLSIPELRGLVPRHPGLVLRALDRHGKPFLRQASDYEARIIQHEFDHLNGIIFLDRMRDMRSLAFAAELDRYWSSGETSETEAVA